MPDNGRTTPLIKMKVGTIASLEENPNSPAFESGSVLFAVDSETGKGKIIFDLPSELIQENGYKRIVMSTDAEFADYATTAGTANYATNAGTAAALLNPKAIDGVNYDGSEDIIHYVTCSTAGNTAVKTATCEGFKLAIGSRVMVKFSNKNTAQNPTLNISNTGAKPIFYRGASIATDYIQAGDVHEYVYDGTN